MHSVCVSIDCKQNMEMVLYMQTFMEVRKDYMYSIHMHLSKHKVFMLRLGEFIVGKSHGNTKQLLHKIKILCLVDGGTMNFSHSI